MVEEREDARAYCLVVGWMGNIKVGCGCRCAESQWWMLRWLLVGELPRRARVCAFPAPTEEEESNQECEGGGTNDAADNRAS